MFTNFRGASNCRFSPDCRSFVSIQDETVNSPVNDENIQLTQERLKVDCESQI